MGIMPAGVRETGPGGGIGGRLGVLNTEGVDVRPDRDHRTVVGRSAEGRVGNHAEAVPAQAGVQSRLGQLFREVLRRLPFLPARLGMGMQISPDLDQPGLQVSDVTIEPLFPELEIAGLWDVVIESSQGGAPSRAGKTAILSDRR